MILHTSPSIRTRRDSGPGDASQDAPNVNDIAASRAAWRSSGGKYIVEGGELRFNPNGWPEPERPRANGSTSRTREKRAVEVANLKAEIERAIGRPYTRPPTGRGYHWFIVKDIAGERARYPITSRDAARAVEAGMVVALELGRRAVDEVRQMPGGAA